MKTSNDNFYKASFRRERKSGLRDTTFQQDLLLHGDLSNIYILPLSLLSLIKIPTVLIS